MDLGLYLFFLSGDQQIGNALVTAPAFYLKILTLSLIICITLSFDHFKTQHEMEFKDKNLAAKITLLTSLQSGKMDEALEKVNWLERKNPKDSTIRELKR